MSTEPSPEPGLDQWGMPIPRYDPPAADPELGVTTDEDGWDDDPPTDPTIVELL